MVDTAPPPVHVAAAFGADPAAAMRMPGTSGNVWRFGDVVLRPTSDAMASAWASTVFEALRVTHIRIARPVRSLDGRWVVGGWSAQRFLSGRPAARFDDTITAGRYLARALRNVEVPRFLRDRADLAGWADRLAWDSDAEGLLHLGGEAAATWVALAARRRPVDAPHQLVHADLFGNVLFAGAAPPGIIDFAPLVRPAEFPAAVLAVDAVAWGQAPVEWALSASGDASWDQLLLRALLFRVAMVSRHPRATASSRQSLMRAVAGIRDQLS